MSQSLLIRTVSAGDVQMGASDDTEAIHLGGHTHHDLSHPVPHSDLTYTLVDATFCG